MASPWIKIKYSIVKKRTLLPLKFLTDDYKRRNNKSLKTLKNLQSNLCPMTMLPMPKMKTWSSFLCNLLRRHPRSKKTMSK